MFLDLSPFRALVTELPNLPLIAAAALAIDAHPKAVTLMSTPLPSFTHARPTPPMIGTSIKYARRGLISIGGMRRPTTAAKTGSHALTICAKLTAPTPMASTDPACATHAQRPIGTQAVISAAVKFGVLRRPVIHITALQTIPTTSWAHATNQCAWIILVAFLLYTLYRVFPAYQAKTRRASLIGDVPPLALILAPDYCRRRGARRLPKIWR
mmetsp:Transcript_39889/g.81431  ORF Transcript_39889/g.81431 Transcript_39889/m.81431 type:complete len:212 (+) Transcript_39889:929-1564(+)